MRKLVNWVGGGLLVSGALLVGYWTWASIDARLAQDKMSERLAAVGSQKPAPSTMELALETRKEALDTGLVGRIEIERIGLSAIIHDGMSNKTLRRGVGHVLDSPYPGEPGNVGLAAHRDTYFRKLENLETGDRVRLTTPDGVFDYAVDSMWIVPPTRTDFLGKTQDRALTLVTCYPFYYVGPAPKRFIARARLLP